MKRPFQGFAEDILCLNYDKKALDKVNPLFKELITKILVKHKTRISLAEICNKLENIDVNNQ